VAPVELQEGMARAESAGFSLSRRKKYRLYWIGTISKKPGQSWKFWKNPRSPKRRPPRFSISKESFTWRRENTQRAGILSGK